MTTRHQAREVSLFALYSTATQGQHLAPVRSGTWPEVLAYLNATARHAGARCLFIETPTGALAPLMA